jgi:rhamnulokinase
VTEFTVASTSQMLEAGTGRWSPAILEALGLEPGLMPGLVPPGTAVGPLSPDLEADTGLAHARVVAPATHDTASAVAAVPAQGRDFAYLSAGTWSLVGTEIDRPQLGPEALARNVTNEGGVEGRTRLLKNVMGLWILQEARRSFAGRPGYPELVRAAASAPPLVRLIDPDHPGFLHPPDMAEAIASFCRRTGQPPPGNPGETTRTILESLALAHRRALEDVEAVCGVRFPHLHVIGGGSNNELLCRFTASALGRPVLAGPAEATALGNLLVQAMADGRVADLAALRAAARRSMPVRTDLPEDPDAWEEAFARFCALDAPTRPNDRSSA